MFGEFLVVLCVVEHLGNSNAGRDHRLAITVQRTRNLARKGAILNAAESVLRKLHIPIHSRYGRVRSIA